MKSQKKTLLYDISDKPKTAKEWIFFSLQQVLAVIVATLLISAICGTPASSCLIGACIGTLIYQLITGFKSPMFISSCGATCSAVIGALALPSATGHQNYLMVAIGGLIIFAVYAIFAFIVKKTGFKVIDKIFPPVIVGPVTMVIGLNLAKFIMSYTGNSGKWEVLMALFVMGVIALSSHYFKGFLKMIPFLIGIIAGYIVALILTVTGAHQFIDFSVFAVENWKWYPDFVFLNWDFAGDISWSNLLNVLLLFIPVAVCALLEHYSDHKCLSNIIGTDLTKKPGLHRTLLGDGAASFVGSSVCGLPNTSYGESIAAVGFSRVASIWVITVAACILGALSFIAPVNAFFKSIPSCCFGGAAMILYGYIAGSGLKTIINSKADLEDNKNTIIVSAILTIGVSGIFVFSESFTGVSLAMVVGVILNLILRETKAKKKADKETDTVETKVE